MKRLPVVGSRDIRNSTRGSTLPVELTHIGEDLVAALLESLSQRNMLAQVACAISGRTLAEDIEEYGLGSAIHFHADDANLIVQGGDRAFSCDGEQTVDVLCAGDKRAIAFEAKLGLERLGYAQFGKDFCLPCEKSEHVDDRISGSMIAVLERSLPFPEPCRLVAARDDKQWEVEAGWWLVLRQKILNKWLKTETYPVASARIISFDALAQLHGSRDQFDQLVQRVVGAGFAKRWGIPLNES